MVKHEVSGKTYNGGIVYQIPFNVDVNDMLLTMGLKKDNYNQFQCPLYSIIVLQFGH